MEQMIVDELLNHTLDDNNNKIVSDNQKKIKIYHKNQIIIKTNIKENT